jgi:hypothetical protein
VERSGTAATQAPADALPPATLSFDEAELARLAAAAACSAARAARAEAELVLRERETAALERLAAGLARADEVQRRDRQEQRGHVLALIGAVVGALGAGRGRASPESVLAAVDAVLHQLPATGTARLLVEPDAVEPLRLHLPDLVQRIGFAGDLTIEGEPRLAAGSVRLLWPDGWSEHDPERVKRLILAALAAHAPDGAATASAAAPNPTDDGEA